jgi:hypothetical protein|tara:strand:+ start:51 stop:518 length:468 start_codon:yes stop_codon:yes gene_type:complete
MPHIPGHTYVISGTNEPYSGRVIMIGGEPFTSESGTIDGFRQKLEDSQQNQTTTNPVTRTFVSRVVYYRQDGSEVPIGSDLHEHQQGQIMLGHDPNNMGAIVTRNRPISSNGNNGQMRTQTRTSTPRQTRTQTSTRRTSGTRNRTSGGGMGGGSY